jgi:hypothetical protein
MWKQDRRMKSRKSNIDNKYKGYFYTTKKNWRKEKLLSLLKLKLWIMPSHYNN